MKRSYVSLVVLVLVAGYIAMRGIGALQAHHLRISPRHGEPYELFGTAADMMGLAYLGFAGCLLSGWFAFQSANRTLAFGLLAFFGSVSAGCVIASQAAG